MFIDDTQATPVNSHYHHVNGSVHKQLHSCNMEDGHCLNTCSEASRCCQRCTTTMNSLSNRPQRCTTTMNSLSNRLQRCMTTENSLSNRPQRCMTTENSLSNRPTSSPVFGNILYVTDLTWTFLFRPKIKRHDQTKVVIYSDSCRTTVVTGLCISLTNRQLMRCNCQQYLAGQDEQIIQTDNVSLTGLTLHVIDNYLTQYNNHCFGLNCNANVHTGVCRLWNGIISISFHAEY